MIFLPSVICVFYSYQSVQEDENRSKQIMVSSGIQQNPILGSIPFLVHVKVSNLKFEKENNKSSNKQKVASHLHALHNTVGAIRFYT
jgi:hypothetical protein